LYGSDWVGALKPVIAMTGFWFDYGVLPMRDGNEGV
jgi:hypothetical protein